MDAVYQVRIVKKGADNEIPIPFSLLQTNPIEVLIWICYWF